MRMGGGCNKLFVHLNGLPVIIRSISLFESLENVVELLLAVRAEQIPMLKSWFHSYRLKKHPKLILGGATRQESVMNMLQNTGDSELIAIHDGARPLLQRSDFIKLQQRVQDGYDGAILASKAVDTIKIVNGSCIEKTPNRDSLIAAQTPQLFKAQLIKEAYNRAKKEQFIGTDDASLMERAGYRVSYLLTSEPNLKITYKTDLLYCEAILNGRRRTTEHA